LNRRALARREEQLRQAERPDDPALDAPSQHVLSLGYEAAPIALVASDEEGRLLDGNLAAQALLGFGRDELRRQTIFDLIVGTEICTMSELGRLRQSGAWQGEQQLRRKDGSVVPVDIAVAAATPGPEVIYLASVFDLSERVESTRRQRESLESLVSEIRNSLAPVVGLSRVLLRESPVDAGAADDISSHALRLERQLDRLVEAALVAADPVEISPRVVDLAQVVALTVEEIRWQSGEEAISLVTPREQVLGLWDAARIGQVLRTLIANAIRLSPDGAAVEVGVEASGGSATVRVRDRGVGLAPERLSSIFERYRPDAPAESRIRSVGLSLCRRIVEAHRGRIWAESDGVEKGATFLFSLPC
jgi:PAS domain S-box-containing protein